MFNLPEHLFFFSPEALRRLLRGCGMRVTRVTREWQWVPAAYLLERVFKRIPAVGRAARASLLSRLVLPATLLDVIGVYARRERS